MSAGDETAAIHELEAARDRHNARQASKDALALVWARASGDDSAAERLTMTCDNPRTVAYCVASVAAGVMLAMADATEQSVDIVLERFAKGLDPDNMDLG